MEVKTFAEDVLEKIERRRQALDAISGALHVKGDEKADALIWYSSAFFEHVSTLAMVAQTTKELSHPPETEASTTGIVRGLDTIARWKGATVEKTGESVSKVMDRVLKNLETYLKDLGKTAAMKAQMKELSGLVPDMNKLADQAAVLRQQIAPRPPVRKAVGGAARGR